MSSPNGLDTSRILSSSYMTENCFLALTCFFCFFKAAALFLRNIQGYLITVFYDGFRRAAPVVYFYIFPYEPVYIAEGSIGQIFFQKSVQTLIPLISMTVIFIISHIIHKTP